MNRHFFAYLLGLIALTFSTAVFAQDISDIGQNVVESGSALPGLLAGLSYLSGILFAVTGIYKSIEHVSNPNQVPLKTPVVRFLIGGGLFSLPIITEAVYNTITAGATSTFDPQAELMTQINSVVAMFSAITFAGSSIDAIFESILRSVRNMPAVITALGYLLGTLLSVSALYKTRDHVEDPTRVPLKDPVLRFIAAGALFALPTVYEAMYETIAGGGLAFGGIVASLFTAAGFLLALDDPLAGINCVGFGGAGVDEVICNAMRGTVGLPVFLTMVSYLLGLVLGLWAIIKIRDHVQDPQRVPLHEGISRLIAGGVFFSMPAVATIISNSFMPVGLLANVVIDTALAGAYNENLTCGAGTNSLDEAMGCFMSDVLGPTSTVLNFFCFCAGMIFVMVGTSRLIRSAQEGARGPGGLGTLTTFFVGGILMSFNVIIRAFSSTFFGSTVAGKNATLAYTTGMSATELDATYNVISAVLRFMVIVGLISFARGIFILRDVAEGKQQASMMAGITHIVGGAFAVNMGPLMNAIQTTLGITAWGVSFS